jgi:hypothetical protein
MVKTERKKERKEERIKVRCQFEPSKIGYVMDILETKICQHQLGFITESFI